MLGIVRRALRNLIRSPLRTALIVAILAVSVGLALTMLTVHGASQNQLGSIGGEIGTEITVRPAGHFGMMGGGEPLDEAKVDELCNIPHVVSVQKTIQTQYTGDALESAIESGTLGRARRGFGGGSFTMPIMTMGFDPAIEDPELMGDAQMEIVEGRYFTLEEIDADVMVVGQALADKGSVQTKLTLYPQLLILLVETLGGKRGNKAVLEATGGHNDTSK